MNARMLGFGLITALLTAASTLGLGYYAGQIAFVSEVSYTVSERGDWEGANAQSARCNAVKYRTVKGKTLLVTGHSMTPGLGYISGGTVDKIEFIKGGVQDYVSMWGDSGYYGMHDQPNRELNWVTEGCLSSGSRNAVSTFW